LVLDARNERAARTASSAAMKPYVRVSTDHWPLITDRRPRPIWHPTGSRSIFTRSIQWSETQTSTQQTSGNAPACICIVVSAIDRADSIVWLRL